MDGLYFLVPTLLVVFVSFLIVRAAAIALMMTGKGVTDLLCMVGPLEVLRALFREE